MMTLYIAITVFVVLAFFLQGRKGSYYRTYYLMICFAIMLLLHTFFNPEYLDNYFYKLGFAEYKSMSFTDVVMYNSPSLKAETGYRILCKLVSYLTSNWVVCMFVISAIMLSGYYYSTKKYSEICWLSVLLIMTGPFVQSLFVLRQHLAIGVLLLSIPFILKRDIISYLLLCVLAISFHQTAAIFVPTYFIYNLRRTKVIYTLFIVGFIVLYYYFSFFLTVSASLAMDTATYGDYYLEIDKNAGSNNKMALLMALILVLRILILQKEFFKVGLNKLMSIIIIIGTIISIVGIGFIATNRLNMYYTALAFLYIPNTFSNVRRKEIRFLMCMFYFLFTLFFMVKNLQKEDVGEFWFFFENAFL